MLLNKQLKLNKTILEAAIGEYKYYSIAYIEEILREHIEENKLESKIKEMNEADVEGLAYMLRGIYWSEVRQR